jgi:hypothetical protein
MNKIIMLKACLIIEIAIGISVPIHLM